MQWNVVDDLGNLYPYLLPVGRVNLQNISCSVGAPTVLLIYCLSAGDFGWFSPAQRSEDRKAVVIPNKTLDLIKDHCIFEGLQKD